MRKSSTTLAAALLFGCLAACGDHGAAMPELPAGAQAASGQAPENAIRDGDAVARYACQGDTEVVLLDKGVARVSLPGGERHTLERVANSDPKVYAGDSLYLTLGTGTAHLSQQDGTRELACTLDATAG